jgi:hypothetical protein
MEMRKQLEYHEKRKKKLFDYYSEDKEWVKTYFLTVDWKTVYKDKEALSPLVIKWLIKYHSEL